MNKLEKLNKTTFKLLVNDNPKDRIEVEIGDSKQNNFFPQVKIQRWDNEVNCSIRLISNEKTPTIKTEDNKIKWQGNKIEAYFYDIEPNEEHPEGGYEFEVVLKEKPENNIIQFSLIDKDIDYFYQDGGYVMCIKTPKTNWIGGKLYRTGKVGDILRPKIIDSVGKETYGTLNINKNEGILSIEISQEFLNGAIYPVSVDPTFGYTTQPTGLEFPLKNALRWQIGTPVDGDGVVDSITFWVYSYTSGAVVKGAIYTYVAGLDNQIPSLSPQTEEWTANATGWHTLNFTNGPSVVNGTRYDICVWGGTQSISTRANNGSGSQSGRKDITYGDWPDPLTPTWNDQTFLVGIYATYEPLPPNATMTGISTITGVNTITL